MRREGDRLFAELPHQSPAGKLEYFIEVASPTIERSLPTDRTVVIRFKGHVPLIVLLPHVILMFTAMLLSNAAGFEALTGGTRLKPYTIIAAVCLGLGGLILGPTVQKFAFGEFWTGIPWGYDLTDNKTLIAACFWAAAVWQVTRPPKSSRRWWVLAASLVLFAIYMIPHSAMGSELDPSTGEIKTGAAPHAIVTGERPA